MKIDEEIDRVHYFNPGDLSYPFQMERIKTLLNNHPNEKISSINDAIELHQCYLILHNCLTEEIKTQEPFNTLLNHSNIGNSFSFKFVAKELKSKGLKQVIDKTSFMYQDSLIRMISEGSLFSLVDESEVHESCSNNPRMIHSFLIHGNLAKKYSSVFRQLLIAKPEIATHLIIDAKALNRKNIDTIHIPETLSSEDVNNIFQSYINSNDPHNGYLDVIADWRNDWGYVIRPEIKSAAKQVSKKLVNQLFSIPHGSFSYGVNIGFHTQQKECINISIEEDHFPTYLFSQQWVKSNLDFPTLLNNFIYLFDYADRSSLLNAAKPEHARSTFLETIEIKAKDAYPLGISFNLENMRTFGILQSYYKQLQDEGIELESLIEWYFNFYIKEEYKIDGFRIDIERNGSLSSRCTSLCAQIERVLKAYSLYTRLGKIDKYAFEFEQFSSFFSLPSKIDKKYVIGLSEEFNRACYLLFSDQCMLTHDHKNPKSNYENFVDRLINSELCIKDIHETELDNIRWLINNHFLIEETDTQKLLPTTKLLATKRVWREGCMVYLCESHEMRELIDRLVNEGFLEYKSKLLAPQEAKYFSYFYHNKDFSNSLALRNYYAHGSDLNDDPNSHTHEHNYYMLLRLLIQIIIKIDNEFSLDNESDLKIEFVDWPLYKLENSAITFLKAKGTKSLS